MRGRKCELWGEVCLFIPGGGTLERVGDQPTADFQLPAQSGSLLLPEHVARDEDASVRQPEPLQGLSLQTSAWLQHHRRPRSCLSHSGGKCLKGLQRVLRWAVTSPKRKLRQTFSVYSLNAPLLAPRPHPFRGCPKATLLALTQPGSCCWKGLAMNNYTHFTFPTDSKAIALLVLPVFASHHWMLYW